MIIIIKFFVRPKPWTNQKNEKLRKLSKNLKILSVFITRHGTWNTLGKKGNLNNNMNRCGAWYIIGILCMSFNETVVEYWISQMCWEFSNWHKNIKHTPKTENRRYKIEVRCQVLNHLCYLFFDMYVNHYVNEYHMDWSDHKIMKNKEYRDN